MENLENNMSELDEMKQQYATLKEQFDRQQIVNEHLMKLVIRSKTRYFRRYRIGMMVAYPIATAFGVWFLIQKYGAIMLWPSIALVVLMAVCVFLEFYITRFIGTNWIENKDLLTLSRQAAQASRNYLIFMTLSFIAIIILMIFIAMIIMEQQSYLNNSRIILRLNTGLMIGGTIIAVFCAKFVQVSKGVMDIISESTIDEADFGKNTVARLMRTVGISIGVCYMLTLGLKMLHIPFMASFSYVAFVLCIVYGIFLAVFLTRNAQKSRLFYNVAILTAIFFLLTLNGYTEQYFLSRILAVVTAFLVLFTIILYFANCKKK